MHARIETTGSAISIAARSTQAIDTELLSMVDHFRKPRILCPILVLLIGLCTFVQNGMAQNTGSISGVVVDSSGAAVPGAFLELTDQGTMEKRTTSTSGQGYFIFVNLPPKLYRLAIKAPSFKEYVNDSLRLAVGQQMSLQPTLPLGDVTQSVEISDTPPPIDTATATVGQVIESKEIDNLPLNGRNALNLVLLVPGVLPAGNAGQFGVTEQQFQFSGSDTNDNNFSLDGGFNMNAFYGTASNYPNPDALQEFNVSTRTYDASLGRGFNSISAVTKSGTDTLHGTVFEFFRNTVLDAANYFSTSPSPYKRNQFGGTLGGKVINDKLFYFGSYQGTQIRGTPGVDTYVDLTQAQRNGDFSALGTPIIDPSTGQPFSGNMIPSNRIESFASQFISKYLPLPNTGSNLYSFAPASSESENQAIVRVDYAITAKDQTFVRYIFDDMPQVGNGVNVPLNSTWLDDLPTRRQSILLNYARTISRHMVNSATFDYDRDAYGVRNRTDFSLTGLGLDINDDNALNTYGLVPDSWLSVGPYFSAAGGVPTRDIVPVTHFSDRLTLTAGAHEMSAGVEIYHTRVNQLQNFLTDGQMSFNGFATGNAAADFLLGQFVSYEQLTPLITRLRQTLPSLYAQDNIKMTRRLTVNLGIRWDPYFPWISQNNVLGVYIPGRQSTVFPLMAPGLLFPGDSGIPRGVASNRYNNVAPRVGLAWDVFGNGRTSVRLGGGIFFMPTNDAINFNRFPQMPPFGFEALLNAGDADHFWAAAPYNGVDPFPRPNVTDVSALKQVPFVAGTGDTSYGLPFKTPVEDQWSVSAQQQMPGNSVLEVAYVGSEASHILSSHEGNPAVYVAGQSSEANTQQRRLDPTIGPINILATYLSSNYNAMEISFTKRYGRGVSLLSSYTWSKALGVVGADSEGSNGQRDPFDPRLDYAVQPFSVKSNWATAAVWDIPYGDHAGSAIARALIAGWQINGIYTIHSGYPFTVNSGLDNSFSDIGGDTADLIGDPHLSGGRSLPAKLSEWFNTSAYTQNAIGTFGNSSIDSLRGPGYWDLDCGAIKHFTLRENLKGEFRALSYNVFNHPTFSNPTSVLTSPIFGQITGTSTSGNPRIFEFATRLSF